MRRGAILIGVNRTGNLPELNDAAASATRMYAWAIAQGIGDAKLITDQDGGEVTAKRIKDAVKTYLDNGVGQVLVYFSGHGINRNRGEYWLLSGAPDDPQEAVNVSGSEDLARTSGFEHVVLISDACRTAADSIQAGSVTGSEIFPNKDGREVPVDQFFASRLGMPANEVKDVHDSVAGFKALYTGELLPALEGKVAKVVEWANEQGKRKGYIRPQALGDYLKEAMLARLSQPQFAGKLIQEPSDRILSRPPAWISTLDGAALPAAPVVPPAPAPAPGAPPLSSSLPPGVPRIDSGLGSWRGRISPQDMGALIPGIDAPAPSLATKVTDAAITGMDLKSATDVVTGAKMTAVPFGPLHQESKCGFKVRGARFIEAIALGARTEMTNAPGDVARVWLPPKRGTPVLLVLENGSGLVLPAIPEYLGALTFERGELADVSYEPSDNTALWTDFKHEAQDLRELRGIASAATRSGVFRLQGEKALEFAQRMQNMKFIDPTLAVYAAYAYNDLQKQDPIKQMDQFMRGGLGDSLFDVAMLARSLEPRKPGDPWTMQGFAPLLAQGWAYLRGRRIKLPPGLEALPEMLHDSLWTMFKPEGVKRLRATLFKGGPT